MKIAICFNGMLRTGVETYPNIKRYIGELYDYCDFFMHTWDLDYYNFIDNDLDWSSSISQKKLSMDKFNEFINLYKVKLFEIENEMRVVRQLELEYAGYISKDGWWIPWFYSWYRSILLKRKYEKMLGFTYDIVIKIRPDVIFREDLRLVDLLKVVKKNVFAVNWLYLGEPKIVDDMVLISDSTTSDIASSFWIDRIIKQTCLLYNNPNDELYHFLNKLDLISLNYDYVGSQYKIGLYRQECCMFDPLIEFDKCVECDRLHYHPNWIDKFNFLSPEDLDKISENTYKLRKIIIKKLNEGYQGIKWT